MNFEFDSLDIAVLVPCHNEALTIKKVIADFKTAIPSVLVYVYDNNSDDGTFDVALESGAIVKRERKKGKGNVVRRMFADIDADIYILVDGDATYDASAAVRMVEKLISENLDMVVGKRVEPSQSDEKAYRFGHRFGNKLFTQLIATLFGYNFEDVLSGYRVFSRRFVKSFPANSRGFEIETELTIHSLELRLPAAEIETSYLARPEGSNSKLNKYRDGLRILWRIIILLKEVRPLLFFGSLFFLFSAISITLFLPILYSFVKTGLVERLPTATLSMGVMLLAFISLACGLILDNVSSTRQVIKHFFYLSQNRFKK